MKQRVILILLFLLAFFSRGIAQEAVLRGKLTNEKGQPLPNATIRLVYEQKGVSTDSLGDFSLRIKARDSVDVVYSFVGYQSVRKTYYLSPYQILYDRVVMQELAKLLQEVEVQDNQGEVVRDQVGVNRIKPKDIEFVPSPFGEFNNILATLPGVVQNNELSSAYSVRGGNFDENLVYVNSIPIYRPFLVRAGRQEGLSFVNPSMVGNIQFSSGGWQAKWGDKLSSTLNIEYKTPDSTAGSASVSLLGGSLHLEGTGLDKKFTYLLGVRQKSSQYILNTLETEGEYLPRFTDLQAYFTYKLSEKTKLGFLSGYGRNRYLVQPTNRTTEFGTFQQSFRLFVAFEGQELLNYDIYQNALKLDHQWNKKLSSEIIVSSLYTTEREYVDLEGGYRLCDVDKRPGSESFDECLVTLGIGTDYQSIRNRLQATILNVESRNKYNFSAGNVLEFGLRYSYEDIQDKLNEWEFIDSADFVKIKHDRLITNDINLLSNRLQGYLQNTSAFNKNRHMLTYGVRFNYWDFNKQLLVSPRVQYAYRPKWQHDVVFTAGAGFYRQPPFYRELRTYTGEINRDVMAQSSFQLIVGADMNLLLWDRMFNFVSEVYYKRLWDVNAYEVDNVRIRYFANNLSEAYATGADFRLTGEFIEGAESWVSFGILKTMEDIPDDGKGFIRRPSDQRVNMGLFFQDHLPNDASIRGYLKFLFGSGLPFSAPQNIKYRNFYNGQAYWRADLGISKIIDLRKKSKYLNSLWIGLEVLNVFGVDNVISYTWVKDFNNQQFAIPNSLSNRFLNLKLVAEF